MWMHLSKLHPQPANPVVATCLPLPFFSTSRAACRPADRRGVLLVPSLACRACHSLSLRRRPCWGSYNMARRGEWRTHTEDAWNWDLSGFVHVPCVLSEAELRAARAATSQPGPLDDSVLTAHPTLLSFVRRLCGGAAPLFGHANAEERVAFRLDRPASLLLRSDAQRSSVGDRHRLRYDTTARPDMVVPTPQHDG